MIEIIAYKWDLRNSFHLKVTNKSNFVKTCNPNVIINLPIYNYKLELLVYFPF